MGFRRSTNRHFIWDAWCAEGGDLLYGLPAEAYRTEKSFRTLLTGGALPALGISLDQFTDAQIESLWEFIQHHTNLDMDASTFDAFNERFRKIHRERDQRR